MVTGVSRQSPAGRTGDPAAEHQVYGASGLRKLLIAIAFLLLLPFFVSLPIMIGQRLLNGTLLDTWGLVVIGIGFAIIMALLLFELMFSLRARIEIGREAFRYTLPAGRSFILPMLSYRQATIPYNQILAVETRREIYGGSVVPVMMRGARVVTREGQMHSLGYISEAEVDPQFPIPDIARRIADRAGVELIDRGSVWRRATNKMLGIKAEEDVPITEQDIARLNSRHRIVFVVILGGMIALLAGGITYDFATGTKDRGERARDAQVLDPPGPASVSRPAPPAKR